MADTLAFGIASNSLPTGYTGVVNHFTSDYNYEKTEKDFTGNPPVVIETKKTAEKWKQVMSVLAAFSAKPDAQAVVNMLGKTDVTVTITSLDPATPISESITGTLTKATHTGDKDNWWEVSLQVEKIMTPTA